VTDRERLLRLLEREGISTESWTLLSNLLPPETDGVLPLGPATRPTTRRTGQVGAELDRIDREARKWARDLCSFEERRPESGPALGWSDPRIPPSIEKGGELP
jgi:hypothetical protein